MGFAGLSFLGGAAKRGSEILQEERDNVERVTDSALKFWTETGIGKYNERKNKRKDLSMKFDTLVNNGFSGDQIDVIAREGGVDKVLNHIEAMKASKLPVKPADIVRMSGDYKETGRTKDEIISGYMGRVNRGMNMSDALSESGVKSTGFLGQDLTKIARKRAEAVGSAFGMPMGELRALATDDITMDPAVVTGQLFLEDPVAAARAETTIEGKETGAFTQGSAMRALQKRAGVALGVDLAFDQAGNPIFSADKADLAAQALDIGRKATVGYQSRREEDKKITSIQALDAATEDMLAGISNVSNNPPSSSLVVQPSSTVGTGVYGGMTTSSIQAQVLKDAKGLSLRQQVQILNQARNGLIQDLQKSMTPADAAVEADKIIDRLESQL